MLIIEDPTVIVTLKCKTAYTCTQIKGTVFVLLFYTLKSQSQ
jgi:hypothetical protein